MFGWLRPAISTIIVSPTAREIARTKDAMIPEIAAGTTIRVETWSLVDPRAYAPSRRSCDRGHRVLRDGGDRRQEHHSHHEACAAALKTPTPTPMSWRSGVMNVSAK